MFARFFSTIIAAGAILAFAGGPGQAQGDIAAKVQICSFCHGAADGVPRDPKTMPIIWGQQPYYLFKQMVNYRNGMREHPVMSPIAKNLQPADLRPIAAYFAAKPWPANPAPAAAPPPNGITLCAACHQAKFEGGVSWPRLAGLSYRPMVRLDTKRGDVFLGPADETTCEYLLRAVKSRLESKS